MVGKEKRSRGEKFEEKRLGRPGGREDGIVLRVE